MRISILCILITLCSGHAIAQMPSSSRLSETAAGSPQPFLFSVTTLSESGRVWSLAYSGSYGERTFGPFGYDGLGQQLAIKGYLGKRFTLWASVAAGFPHSGKITSAQQAEIIRDLVGGKKQSGPRLGLSFGVSRDWENVKSVSSRITASFDAAKWRFGGNMRFEKSFNASRDKIDFTTSAGFHHSIGKTVYGGIEAVGQDLEGFWEEDEAEGGARLFIGPSVNIVPGSSRFGFSACGGPVFYATRSNAVPSQALRDLSLKNGYTVRAMVSFNLQGN
ncbi:hypothetical protein [Hufsiella ginkgonis]|uniref:Uncharacterized protein n=1 Tax=Hufsiella ginkgonis TaxID=2695274 RepID=A0A7K1XZG1_9SPHI|nr:hypothetical protein [Hufsiella ginkgonis]MXV16404.1 hypothetical protein [Hufsiella ginkgonis]